jgi:hypothetical protein
MTRRFMLFLTLAVSSALAHAHDGLTLDGALHRALHAIGSERLVVMGAVMLAIAVGLIVRRAMRNAARRQNREG